MDWSRHLLIVPILLPLVTGAALLLIDELRHSLKALINLASTLLLLVVALVLMRIADGVPDGSEALSLSYAMGNWPAPFAIVLVLDRLAALMLALAAVVAAAALIFSLARWHRAGPHFHTLFQFLLMGLGGAFLTGDLFNLFVFFEVTLAASYGLLLHGSGAFRVRSGLHYIAINLAASLLFLVGVSLIYGVAGTLNMADLATRIPLLSPSDLTLLQTGAAVLGVAFLVKAGMWPLGMWLPATYAAAAPPVAAMFAILSKLGVYVVLRLTALAFGDESGVSANFGDLVLQYGGLATIVFGTIGVLASQGVARIACFSVLVSSGTTLAVIGYGDAGATAGALYYLVNSTLALACLFLLIELMERGRSAGDDVLAVTLEAYGDDEELHHEQEVGTATPGAFATLGAAFICCAILIAGMPPLSGFLGKFAIISAMLDLGGESGIPGGVWALVAVLIVSGLAATVALMRHGINTFWVSLDGVLPAIRWVEAAAIVMLLALGVLMTIFAQPVMGFMDMAADTVYARGEYLNTVLSNVGVVP